MKYPFNRAKFIAWIDAQPLPELHLIKGALVGMPAKKDVRYAIGANPLLEGSEYIIRWDIDKQHYKQSYKKELTRIQEKANELNYMAFIDFLEQEIEAVRVKLSATPEGMAQRDYNRNYYGYYCDLLKVILNDALNTGFSDPTASEQKIGTTGLPDRRVVPASKKTLKTKDTYTHKEIAIACFFQEKVITVENAPELLHRHSKNSSVAKLLMSRISKVSDLTGISGNAAADLKHLKALVAAEQLLSGKKSKEARAKLKLVIQSFTTNYIEHYGKQPLVNRS